MLLGAVSATSHHSAFTLHAIPVPSHNMSGSSSSCSSSVRCYLLSGTLPPLIYLWTTVSRLNIFFINICIILFLGILFPCIFKSVCTLHVIVSCFVCTLHTVLRLPQNVCSSVLYMFAAECTRISLRDQ